MIRDMSTLDWARLVFAFLLFLGPGYGLLSFQPARFLGAFKRFSSLSVVFCLSTAFWAVLFLWLKVIHLPINAVAAFVVCAAGWGTALVRFGWLLLKRSGVLKLAWPSGWDVLEAVLVVIYCVLYLGVVQNLIVGMGSDSYHHTLIAQMFYDQGQIPDNYLPYAPIISFSYHYGFHSFIAVLGWLSGWPLRLLVPVAGPQLVALTGLAAAFLVGTVTRQRKAEPVVLIVVAFLSIFPGYMLNWGRYPQALGSLIMLVLLAYFFLWQELEFSKGGAVWLAVLAAGLSLTHYRVTIMCAVGLVSYLVIELLLNGDFRQCIKKYLLPWAGAVLLTIIFVAPWIYFTVVSHREGVSGALSITGAEQFYGLDRLGNDVLQFPSNGVLIAISIAAILWGIIKRERLVLWVVLWWAALYIVSGPDVLAGYMDRVSFYITVYVPFGLLIGWLAAQVIRLKWVRRAGTAGAVVLGTVALIWGMWLTLQVPQPGKSALAQPENLQAMEWIKANTPKDAVFMVNTYAFPFSNEYIIGIDAGDWIPVLASRNTVVPPMNYQTERFETLDPIHNLFLLHSLNGHLATPEALQLLRKVGVGYIYSGSSTGPISVKELLISKDYKLEYQDSVNYVFSLLPR